jgi:6-phosphofructokinase 1
MGKVGILTGGGDCPGLNAVIRAVVKKCANERVECLGVLDGWKGMVEALSMSLDVAGTQDLIGVGGTILGSSRTNPYKRPEDVDKVVDNFKEMDLDCLVAVGGDDTLGAAAKLHEEHKLNMIGIPKTIDNDLPATDMTFGFDTAVNIAMGAIDRIRTTARSHHRVLVVETMGRKTGWIAAEAGMAAGADVVLVPEKRVAIDQVCEILKKRRAEGQNYNLVVVGEGCQLAPGDYTTKSGEIDEFGNIMLGGIANIIADLIERRTGYETRTVILGHLQRGGAPTAFDRILATRFGYHAAELASKQDYGKMVALRGKEIVAVDLQEAAGKVKALDLDLFKIAEEMFS